MRIHEVMGGIKGSKLMVVTVVRGQGNEMYDKMRCDRIWEEPLTKIGFSAIR